MVDMETLRAFTTLHAQASAAGAADPVAAQAGAHKPVDARCRARYPWLCQPPGQPAPCGSPCRRNSPAAAANPCGSPCRRCPAAAAVPGAAHKTPPPGPLAAFGMPHIRSAEVTVLEQ